MGRCGAEVALLKRIQRPPFTSGMKRFEDMNSTVKIFVVIKTFMIPHIYSIIVSTVVENITKCKKNLKTGEGSFA